MLDLTEQDFLVLSNVTGRVFDKGILKSNGVLSTDVSPNSSFLREDLSGKHSWLSASTSKELSERVRHALSACASDPLHTSFCVLIRQSCPVDMSLVKDARCVLTVSKGRLVRQLHEDGSWRIVRSPERLQVLYRPSVVDKLSAEEGLATGKVIASAAASGKLGENKRRYSRMMFSGRAAGTKANILFDTGASNNFVSKSFAKQTGITVRPVDFLVRLADDKPVRVAGEATVYVQMGSFHKPVTCYVMDMMYEVDVILGEAFMDRYNCILHYGKKCVMIQKGKRHLTLNSPPLLREQPDSNTDVTVLSVKQLKRLVRKGSRVFLAVLKELDTESVPTLDNSVATLANSVSTLDIAGQPTAEFAQPSIQQAPGSELPWVAGMLTEYSDVFKDPLPVGLPPVRSEGHSIPTEPGHPPPFRSMYRLSPLEYRELEKQVTKFLRDGILESSTSPYGAPVLFVPKPNGRGLRLCVDYRALNSITVKNRCTIPRIDDLLDAVSGSKYFTSLDLTSGYHQILISEEDRPKTAFRTPFGHFQFKVLIEGLTNAPATFQTVMNSIFHPYLKKFVVVYIDDILIFSKTEAEHQAHLRIVLDLLRKEKFYVCESKSMFAQTEVKYLGHIVDSRGIRPDPKKVEAVQSWPEPKSVTDVRSFLGLCNYFRKFMDHYSEVAIPLTNLTKKTVKFEWTGRCQDSFQKLKDLLTRAPLLRTPDESLPYEVVTDASDLGLGAVLLQEGRPVAFESRKLNGAELNYTVTEKEMLGVVHALRVWRCYLEGADFTVYTDHVSNTFFQTQPNLSRRQARWSEFLQRFGPFTWEYRKGTRNVADALSRRDVAGSVGRCAAVKPFEVVGSVCSVVGALSFREFPSGNEDRGTFQPIGSTFGRGNRLAGDRESLLTFDLSMSLLKPLIIGSQDLFSRVQGDATWALENQLCTNVQGLVLKNGNRIVVPDLKELRALIMSEYHDTFYAGHYGVTKTRAAVGRLFWWDSLAGDVSSFVSTCAVCQRDKARRHKPYGALQPLTVPEKPWHTVTFDFIVKLPKTERGNDSVCVFVDKLTKVVHFVACQETLSAKDFASLYVDNIFRLHGLSREFITDRDVRFTSAFWKGVTELLGTKLAMSSSFHPQTDGQSERVNQTLETYLRHFVSAELNDWDLLLPRAEFAHNAAYHESIRRAPLELATGFAPRTPAGERAEVVNPESKAFVERLHQHLRFARKSLIAAQQRQKAFVDQKRTERSFSVGDKVLLSTKYLRLKHSETNRKLLPKYVGPFEVVQVVGPVAYKLAMNPRWRIHPVFHVSLLEPYRTDGRVQPPPPPIEVEGVLEYEVETILQHRYRGTRNRKASYLVAWKDYGPEHNTWEPEENLKNAPEVLADYWSRWAQQHAVGRVAYAVYHPDTWM